MLVSKKSGFACFAGSVTVTCDGNLFYFKESKKIPFYFNMPPGEYECDCDLIELSKPVEYTGIKLFKPNMITPLPKKFNIIYKDNPAKCSVDMVNGTIIFDKQFIDCPKYYEDYIKFHELAHYRYRSLLGYSKLIENACDTYADYCMLKIGYNPKQIRAANYFVLSNRPDERWRKKQQYKRLRKVKYTING